MEEHNNQVIAIRILQLSSYLNNCTHCTSAVGPPNSITLCVQGHHNSGKLTVQCSGSWMTTSASFPQDPTTTKMGTGFMFLTITFLRFFHLGRWEAMMSPASACEEVGHSSKITTTLQKHSVACKHCSMYSNDGTVQSPVALWDALFRWSVSHKISWFHHNQWRQLLKMVDKLWHFRRRVIQGLVHWRTFTLSDDTRVTLISVGYCIELVYLSI